MAYIDILCKQDGERHHHQPHLGRKQHSGRDGRKSGGDSEILQGSRVDRPGEAGKHRIFPDEWTWRCDRADGQQW